MRKLEYKRECKIEIFAYCLMSNHVHLLMRHPETLPLSLIQIFSWKP
ncbi:MAG: transposase [Lachnospiraceae bacterium]